MLPIVFRLDNSYVKSIQMLSICKRKYFLTYLCKIKLALCDKMTNTIQLKPHSFALSSIIDKLYYKYGIKTCNGT